MLRIGLVIRTAMDFRDACHRYAMLDARQLRAHARNVRIDGCRRSHMAMMRDAQDDFTAACRPKPAANIAPYRRWATCRFVTTARRMHSRATGSFGRT